MLETLLKTLKQGRRVLKFNEELVPLVCLLNVG